MIAIYIYIYIFLGENLSLFVFELLNERKHLQHCTPVVQGIIATISAQANWCTRTRIFVPNCVSW